MNKGWRLFLKRLLPTPWPSSIRWDQPNLIFGTLERLVRQAPDLHYTFLPDGGGIELTGVEKGLEPGCIQLHAGGSLYVCKPESLVCFAFTDRPQWSYFDLDLRKLDPLDEKTEPGEKREDLRGRVRTLRRTRDEVSSPGWGQYCRFLGWADCRLFQRFALQPRFGDGRWATRRHEPAEVPHIHSARR
jgi:hypothetical protein